MRLVVSLSLMGSSIDPEASSTSTMSSGVVEVDFAFEVGEGVESAVMNAESPRSVAVSLLMVIAVSAVVEERPLSHCLQRRSYPPGT